MSKHISESRLPDPQNKLIDAPKIIAEKNPKLIKLIPGFILRYIKRVIHEDELNEAASRASQCYELDYVAAVLKEFGVKIKTSGLENIPKEGGVILAANHPLGALDGIAFINAAAERRKDILFLVNDLLLTLKNFGSLFIPVNKHGRNTQEYLETIDKAFASSACLLMFPAGLVSRKQKGGVVQDLVWKKSFITKAVQYQKNIVPVFIDGRNSVFFYNLAFWRKKIGIKANVEMFYLVDEMYKQKGKTLTFTFGRPISWKTFTLDHRDEYWAEKVKQHVYALQSGDKSKLLPETAVDL